MHHLIVTFEDKMLELFSDTLACVVTLEDKMLELFSDTLPYVVTL